MVIILSIKIVGEIIRYIFENSDNNYRIFLVGDESGNTYTLNGYLVRLDEEITYEFECEEVNHPKYGLQYKVLSYQSVIDNSKEGIITYLSSNLFPGVGLKCAQKIYEALGDKCLEIIETDPNSLDKVKGMTNGQKQTVYTKILENRVIEKIFVKLYQIGLTNKMVMKLYEKYQYETLDFIEKNPYQLIYDLEGFGFKKADELAMKLGFSVDNKERLKALLVFTMNNISNQYGLTYMNSNQLVTTAYNYALTDTNIVIDHLYSILNETVSDKKLVIENDRVYLPGIYYSEVRISKKLNQILSLPKTKVKIDKIETLLLDFEKINSISLSKEQKEAILTALTNRVSIVTGGPGTGKTTIVKAIVQLYCSLNGFSPYDDEAVGHILLCAPTGKASKRITEQTLFKSSTIHKALGYNFENEFIFNSQNNLPHRLIVIDEVSMIDTILAANLLDAIGVNASVVFVGDAFQLPSIAPGAVLDDLINSKMVPTTYLKTIYRQGRTSNIVKLADMVKEGVVDFNIFNSDNDLLYFPCHQNEVLAKINETVKIHMDYGYSLYDDIQILAPMYKGISGIDAINVSISNCFNVDYTFTVESKDKTFKQGDKVIQLVNSSELKIMNGDIGVINSYSLVQVDDREREVYDVDFTETNVKLDKKDFDNLNLAYAVSIHKSQGSEYKLVILPMFKSYSVMLKRKLIYTAITRAKEKLIIIGDINAFYQGLNEIEKNRQTSLALRLNPVQNKKKINDPDIPFDELGEINMEGITPYSFMV